jgi:hypothetical protein
MVRTNGQVSSNGYGSFENFEYPDSLTLTRCVRASRSSALKLGWFKPASGVGRPQ